MSTLNGPYLNTGASDDDHTGVLPGTVLETTLTATQQPVDIGGGVMANAEVFNGEIPGPTFRLTVGQTVVVRLVNELPYEIGIHWHGIELENYADGTEVTQNGAVPSPIPNGAVSGGTFLYKFKVTRAGIYWYHPHHGESINRVFRGTYGMMVVTDPLESDIVAPAPGFVLPADTPSETMELVLSDITVCKAPAANDSVTYPVAAFGAAEWLCGVTAQFPPSPEDLCELSPTDEEGDPLGAPYAAGDVPSLVTSSPGLRVEGQTVLTNGVNVGARAGTPGAPGALVAGAVKKTVVSGQGLRMRIVNCATLRYFRLRLTRPNGAIVNLLRIGGEGGLLDTAQLEGGPRGTVPERGPDPFYFPGELLIPPGGRADAVAVIPSAGLVVGDVLTLWTRDCQRAGSSNEGGIASEYWAQLPTVPVMHLEVVAGAGAYALAPNDPVRTSPAAIAAGMSEVVELLGSDDLLPPPAGKPGLATENLLLQAGGNPRVDGVAGMDLMMDPVTGLPYPRYTDSPHIGSTRYAEIGRTLQLTITNATHAHHPFHLHGFSFQARDIRPEAGGAPLYEWPYFEFRDTIDLVPHTRLTIRVKLDDRFLADQLTMGGGFGRWLFHCHIFFHHTHGMVGELVVTSGTGSEKPNVNVGGSFAYAMTGMMATRQGTFKHPDAGVNVTALTATRGSISTNPALPAHEGTWSWNYTPIAADPPYDYVYVEAEDAAGRKDQAVFRLQMGGVDTSSDWGDPHIRTVYGPRYDFQAVGEFTLLRDGRGMDIQVRQTPAATPPPVTDGYSGLTTCVSLNSAVAVRVGSHRISYQPFRDGRLTLFIDKKPADLPKAGLDLGDHRLTTFAAGTETGIRIDYAHGPVVTITPQFWNSYGIHYLNVEVTNTDAEGGLMGRIPHGTWLPKLPSGATLGPMPANLDDRYIALYKTFADAWRITDANSLFEYLPGRSTASFTDRNWPPQKPPCTTVPRGFLKPANPIGDNIPIAKAKQICKGVTLDDLNAACVFDVATTGDETFAKAYLLAQDLRLHRTVVQIVGNKPRTRAGEALVVTATVLPVTPKRPIPTGSITFLSDDVAVDKPIDLDKEGRASLKTEKLREGVHRVRALYTPGGENRSYDASSSPSLLHTVESQSRTGKGGAPYDMRGLFYEACDCFTVCPCWVGNSPDGGECTGVFAWEIEAGTIDGIDVAGLLAVSVSHHAGLREEARQRVMIFVDERATRVQADALTAAFSGSLGGPLQELGDLLGELLGVERAPIELRREGRLTTLTVGRRIRIEGTTREGPAGRMTLSEAKLSKVLGSPAELGESGHFRVALPTPAMDLDLRGRSTMSGRFSYRHVPAPGVSAPGASAPGASGPGVRGPGHMG